MVRCTLSILSFFFIFTLSHSQEATGNLYRNLMMDSRGLDSLSGLPVRDTLYDPLGTDSLPDRLYVLNRVERNGEILPEIEIKEVTIIGRQKGRAIREQRSMRRQYNRLIYNLKKVYPYSIIVRDRLYKANMELTKLVDERERRKYMKDLEKEVFAEYEDDMRSMTLTQGRLLIKLVDRETPLMN
jgi:hypothetical protein